MREQKEVRITRVVHWPRKESVWLVIQSAWSTDRVVLHFSDDSFFLFKRERNRRRL